MDNEKESLLTLAEAAEILRCSKSLLYRLIEQKYPLPVVRVGTLIRFRTAELIESFKSFEKVKKAHQAATAQAAAKLADKIAGGR